MNSSNGPDPVSYSRQTSEQKETLTIFCSFFVSPFLFSWFFFFLFIFVIFHCSHHESSKLQAKQTKESTKSKQNLQQMSHIAR